MNKNNIFKKIFLLAIIISFITAFTEFTNSSQNLDDQAYAMGIGIDKGTTNKYKISLQLSTLESSASEASTKSSDSNSSDSNSSSSDSSSGEKSQSTKYIVHTVETDSLDSAINISNSYLNRNVDLSHCKILLLSEEVAKEGVGDIVNALINKVEVRPDCNIIISQIPQNEFNSDENPKIEDILSKYYDVTANTETGRGYSQLVKLNDFYLNLNDSFCQPYATLGITSNTQKNTTSNNNSSNSSLDIQSRSLTTSANDANVETMGLAVFNKDSLVGTLSSNQTLCHELLINNFNYCTLNMPSPFNLGETIDLQLSHLRKPNIKVRINNSSPFVEVKIYVTAKMLSFNDNVDNTLTEEKINTIKNETTKYLENMFYDYFEATSKQFNSDISGIGRYAVKNFKTLQDWENYNWLENYKNSTFKVNVVTSIKSGHLLTNE